MKSLENFLSNTYKKQKQTVSDEYKINIKYKHLKKWIELKVWSFFENRIKMNPPNLHGNRTAEFLSIHRFIFWIKNKNRLPEQNLLRDLKNSPSKLKFDFRKEEEISDILKSFIHYLNEIEILPKEDWEIGDIFVYKNLFKKWETSSPVVFLNPYEFINNPESRAIICFKQFLKYRFKYGDKAITDFFFQRIAENIDDDFVIFLDIRYDKEDKIKANLLEQFVGGKLWKIFYYRISCKKDKKSIAKIKKDFILQNDPSYCTCPPIKKFLSSKYRFINKIIRPSYITNFILPSIYKNLHEYFEKVFSESVTPLAVYTKGLRWFGLPGTVNLDGKNRGSIIMWLVGQNEGNKVKIPERVNYIFLLLKMLADQISRRDMIQIAMKESLRSAVAAIMARNMSHNIGSHVLFYLSKHDSFYKYLQNRMDFVAEISTTEPTWTHRMKLIEDIIRPFVNQVKMLDNIAKSEELTAFKIDIRVHLPSFQYLFSVGETKNLYQTKKSDGTLILFEEKTPDLELDLPHGVIGCHAFYSILENFIRDTIRHSTSEIEKILQSNQNLEIIIETEHYSEELIKIVIKNNLRNYSSKAYKNIKFFLNESFIGNKGELIKSGWGQKEMKICSGWLRNVPAELVPSFQEKHPLLEPIRNPADRNVGYTFYMLKPLDILIIDNNIDQKEIQKEGIYIRNDIKELKELSRKNKLRHNFILIKIKEEEEIRWIEKNLIMLPSRIFVVYDNKLAGIIGNRIIKISSEEYKKFLKDIDITDLYEKLVKWLYGNNLLPKIKVIWSLMDDPFKKISEKLKMLISVEKEIKSKDEIVFDHDKKNKQHEYPNIYYEPFTYMRGTAAKKLSLFFEKKNPQLLFELYEVALTKIIIADERLYKRCKDKIPSLEKEWDIWDLWLKMGVEIINIKKEKRDIYVYKHNKKKKIRLEDFFRNAKNNEFMFFLTHQGIIDKEISEEEFLKLKSEFFRMARNVIIHSGRGHVKITKGFKFVEFSNIERWIDERDKHKLVNLLMKITYKMEG